MAETETTTETKVSKVIANILKAAREQPKQPKSEEVAKVVRRIYPEKTSAPNAKQARAGRIIENAKQVVAEAKTQGVHVSTGLYEWIGQNKLPILDKNPAQAFKIAKSDLAVAIKASDLPKDHWVTQAASRVKNAESAQALAIIALAPEEIRDNPNFIFQTAAQLAGSNLDPETQATTKAFVAELKNLRGVDGFEMGDNELFQALTEGGLGAMPGPAPTPDVFDPALFASLPNEAKNVFQALNVQLRGKSEVEQYQIMASFSTQIEKIDLQGFTQANHEDFNKILVQKASLEARYAPVRGVIKRETFTDDPNIRIEPFGKGNFESRVLSSEQVVEISRRPDDEGDSGIDKFVQSKMRHIFSSSREPRAADLQEQSEYWEIEQLYRYLFGQERAQAKLGELRSQWESEYRRNAIHWYIVRGGASNKEIITELLKGVPPDTMQHEQSILWGPEGIAAYEQVGFEMGTEKRFVFDEGRRWFEERPRSLGGKSRLEAFNAGLLTGRAKTTAEEWQQKIQFGSYITDKDAQFKESAFNNLANIHTRIDRDYQRAKIEETNFTADFENARTRVPGLTEEQFFYDRYESQAANAKIMEDLRREWSDFTLFDQPEVYIGEKLWNFNMLNKWQGCSPLQVRAMIKLESTLKANGVTNLDQKSWKLARAIFAASRSEVGSLRSVGLARQLSNMPALVVAPSGGYGVMNDAWQEQMGRVQDTEVFMRRFMLGGQNQGAEVWSNLIISRLEGIGIKLKSRDTFAPAQSGDESFGMRKARTLLLKSRTHFGMGFTEMPREPLATSMTLYDGTTWRFEPTLKKLDEVYGRVAAKRVGMGMRIAVKSGESVEDLGVRREAWEFTAKRTPSKLVQMMFTEQTDQLLKDKHLIPGSMEWERFNRVLSIVEHNTQTIEANVMRNIDLGNRRDFNRYFSDEVFAACGISDGARIRQLRNDYFDVVHGFQDTFLRNGPEGRLGPKYIDLWAHNKMALTASISDYDIKYTQWDKLPADQLYRRIVSDATGHHGVMEAEIAFMTRSELCVQPDMKKVLEVEATLQSSANSYGTKKDAERIMLTMDDAVVTYMESKEFYRWIRVVPGAKTILRQLAGIDTQKPWARVLARGVRPFLNVIANSPIFVRDAEERRVFREILNTPKIEDWPRKFAQLHLAPTIAAAGPGATTYDPLDVAKHYEELEHAGLVTENHKLLHKMKDKHKARVPWRFLAITQRYWWVPWVATIAVGVIIASKEQGLDDSKSH